MLPQKIILDNTEYITKRSFGANKEFKIITGKDAPKAVDNIPDAIILLFCNLKSANQGKFNYTIDSFIEYITEHPETFDDPKDFTYEIARTARASNN